MQRRQRTARIARLRQGAASSVPRSRRRFTVSDLLRRFGRGATVRRLSLALQGGGSFGAFTWGVLDRLLADEDIAFDMVSGASAGAVNAVVLADGLAEGGPETARRRLAQFWRRLAAAAPPAPLGDLGRAVAAAAQASLPPLSPYQFNPLGINPLRQLLAAEIDFARLRRVSPVALLIAATRVRDGRLRLFREDEIGLEAVLASACLPQLHHAVEIDGEWYWDGAYSANPPLRQLVLDTRADDIVLVQLTPEIIEGVPRFSPAITRRVMQITFNGALQREVEALADLAALCRRQGAFRSRFCRKLQRLRLHTIAAEEAVGELQRASAFDLDGAFLLRLRDAGRAAAAAWLARARTAAAD